ncbi:hypothetical protein IQ268_27340 [Oculatella sp. LEGE 06141]|uniref:hypothetical protein n=1 Tax=Oculatella sp. LEGE 06141 TaxID=1828648 RepID=UPI00187F18D6|nr:hypothetical protein [Oculatella sp. LEGE 06141]MBE9182268.1 hypothetical protein [Oculatella sp. LEGE 06141]
MEALIDRYFSLNDQKLSFAKTEADWLRQLVFTAEAVQVFSQFYMRKLQQLNGSASNADASVSLDLEIEQTIVLKILVL